MNDFLSTLGDVASSYFQSDAQNKATKAQLDLIKAQNAANAQASANWSKYLPWALGAVAIAVVAILVLRRK